MPGGRPTKYTPELLEKAKEYVHNYEMYDQAFPSDIGLALVLGIGTTTLYEWAKDDRKKEFQDILVEINSTQQIVAWNKGLRGEYNAMLVKLLLGKHGHHEKVDTTHSGPNGNPITVDVLHTVSDEALEKIIADNSN